MTILNNPFYDWSLKRYGEYVKHEGVEVISSKILYPEKLEGEEVQKALQEAFKAGRDSK